MPFVLSCIARDICRCAPASFELHFRFSVGMRRVALGCEFHRKSLLRALYTSRARGMLRTRPRPLSRTSFYFAGSRCLSTSLAANVLVIGHFSSIERRGFSTTRTGTQRTHDVCSVSFNSPCFVGGCGATRVASSLARSLAAGGGVDSRLRGPSPALPRFKYLAGRKALESVDSSSALYKTTSPHQNLRLSPHNHAQYRG